MAELPYVVTVTMVILTAIWAGFDAHKIELKKYKTPGIEYGAYGALAIVLGLWIIGFPWYLSMRGKIKRGEAQLRDKYKGEVKPVPVAEETDYGNILSQVEKLAEMKSKGILTEEEFQLQKSRLLSS
ncbi:MAG TPA: SHOCT domain-containing protein [Sedimentisphaerales bacterium]|nr:SHOCT domain-containing protein [Sedimentisphaerales bacterium]